MNKFDRKCKEFDPEWDNWEIGNRGTPKNAGHFRTSR